MNHALKDLGLAQAWMWCAYYGSTPATDALLGVEYVVSKDSMPPGYQPIAQAGELTLWKNPNALPLAFLAQGTGIEGGYGPFEWQNEVFSGLLEREAELFSPAPAQAADGPGERVFTLTGTGRPVYADLSASGLGEVLVNGERTVSLGTSEAACVHYLGTPAAGETWTVTVRHNGGWSGGLWALDMDALGGAVERLRNTQVTSVEKNGRVRLTVLDGEADGLAATIPAEPGWTAYVDGERAETASWLGTFLYVELPAGAREVELRYTAPGLVPGLVLKVLSLAGLALAVLKNRKRQ